MVIQTVALLSQVTVRQIGASGAALILMSALILELRRTRSRWFVGIFSCLIAIGLAALGFSLFHLEVATL